MAASFASYLAAGSHESPSQFFQNVLSGWVEILQSFLEHDLLKLVGVLVFTWLLIAAVNFLARRLIKAAERRAQDDVGRAAQIKTLASVIRATGIAIVVFLATMQLLRDVFNFNLGPLLTSAGVAGVAIGLAAQTIVKDCLNGMLILLEDQYKVGDVVQLAGISGKVESMSLRRTIVRDDSGLLYTIPNSQITIVANKTRDYSVATIPVSVDFTAHPDAVMKVLKDAAMSVRMDPAYSDVFLGDPTLLGVDSIKGSQVIYPVQLRTKANQQWAAMRETQRRIRIALEENGMLPGDPLRVFNPNAAQSTSVSGTPEEPAKPGADPTTQRALETNPFTGETS